MTTENQIAEAPMPRDVALCLNRILDYNWASEQTDYEENGCDNHTFTDMLEVNAWLQDSGLTDA